LTRNSVTLFFLHKNKELQITMEHTKVAGYRL
jgi:hypothetical protein